MIELVHSLLFPPFYQFNDNKYNAKYWKRYKRTIKKADKKTQDREESQSIDKCSTKNSKYIEHQSYYDEAAQNYGIFISQMLNEYYVPAFP